MAARPLSRCCLQLSTPSPAAKAFVQIVSRRSFNTRPMLDFLTPSIPQTQHRELRMAPTCLRSSQQVACFSTTRSTRATVAIHNPKQDEDGVDMAIEITPRASKRLKEIMAKDQNPNLALRITVESGGCHGFQYLMSLTTLPPLSSDVTPPASPTAETSSTEALHTTPNTPAFSSVSINTTPKETSIDEDDTIFSTDDGAGSKVIMDGPSLELLKGSKVDYTMELIGSQFKIVDNPLATSSCGCGTSFDIKA